MNEMKKAVSEIKKLNELKTEDKGKLTAEQPAKSKIESGPIVESLRIRGIAESKSRDPTSEEKHDMIEFSNTLKYLKIDCQTTDVRRMVAISRKEIEPSSST